MAQGRFKKTRVSASVSAYSVTYFIKNRKIEQANHPLSRRSPGNLEYLYVGWTIVSNDVSQTKCVSRARIDASRAAKKAEGS